MSVSSYDTRMRWKRVVSRTPGSDRQPSLVV